METSVFQQAFKSDLDYLTRSLPLLATLLNELGNCGRVVVFGGYVRDRIHNVIHGEKMLSRDLDLVVDGEIRFSAEVAQLNNFGGRRTTIDGTLRVDYWELPNTYAFKHGFFAPSLHALPRTTVYLPNACLYDYSQGVLLESGAINSIKNRTVGFNCRSYLDAYPDYQAFRAMDLARRLNYTLDQEVRDFVRRTVQKAAWADFVAAVQKHRPELSGAHIQAWCEPFI